MNRMSMLKLIKLPFGYYLYDAYINQVVQISERAYSIIKDNHLDQINVPREIQDMISVGFFQQYTHSFSSPDLDVLATMYQRALHSMILQVTQSCNLRCSYCPYTENAGNERLHSNKRMTLDTAKTAVDFLHKHSIDSEMVVIGFYGGEPIIEFPLIQETMEYAKSKFEGKDLLFSITTNATLFSRDILEYLNNNNISLLISIDGPAEINDTNRVFASKNQGSYKYVAEALEIIEKDYPNLKRQTRINMVIDPELDYNKYLQVFDNDSITSHYSIQSKLVDSTELKKDFSSTDDFIMNMRYYSFFNELWINGRTDIPNYRALLLNEDKWSVNDKYIPFNSGPVTSSSSPAGPCIPGYVKLFVNADGEFFPCEKTSEMLDILNIGNLSKGIDISKCAALMSMPSITEEECKQCYAFHRCDSCYIFATSQEGFDREKRLNRCRIVKKDTEELLVRYIISNRNSIRKYI